MKLGENIGIKLSCEVYAEIAKNVKRCLISIENDSRMSVWDRTWNAVEIIMIPPNRMIKIELLKKIPLGITTQRVYIPRPF